MARNPRDIYFFLSDENGQYYRASQSSNGTYIVTKNSQPYPLSFNPSNTIGTALEFGTNIPYFSLNRSISYQLSFIKDGAAILRYGYYNGKGREEKMYATVIQWNGIRNLYELSYAGKIDFKQKSEDPKEEVFSVSTIDDSAWGVLSENDRTEFTIDCSQTNPKAIPVLFDGLTLVDRYTYQPVAAPILYNTVTNEYRFTAPFVLVNQDGDSAGIIVESQQQFPFPYSFLNPVDNPLTPGWFFSTAYAVSGVRFSGNFKFQVFDYLGGSSVSNVFNVYFRTNYGQRQRISPIVFPNPGAQIISGNTYSYDFDFTLDLAAGETVFFIVDYVINNGPIITPLVSNMTIQANTRPQAVVRYGLRPLDFFKELVSKATNGRFTINSNFFVENNKDILFSGDALRGIPNAKIYTTFADAFASFDALYFMALRGVNGALFIEKAVEVYKQDTNIIDLGEVIDLKLNSASDYDANSLEVGCPDQDFRHPSGRLEFNSVNSFSLPLFYVNRKLSYVSRYRMGCFDITFIILDYQNDSTQDNTGDKSVYMAKITDEKGMATDDIENFENITVDDAPLEPIIKSPLNNDVITYNKPVIRGIAPPLSNVNIYVDTVLDGNTTADADGNWSYNIVTALTPYVFGVTTGIHQIQATYTDLSAPSTSITLLIDTSVITTTLITNPQDDQNLYNNIPLIKGISQQGDNFDVLLDGVVIGNVTADESCKWQLQSPVISNGAHIITANGQTVNFNVDSNVDFPLITYIAGELDGFIIINNLPLIKGVAKPGTVVTLWLNYITYVALGSTVADANGDWSFQVVPRSYLDPVTGIPVVVAPIRNGLSVISTDLVVHTVGIVVTGYKLSRPAYSSITGVTDNTVFNTEYSPKRMLENHYPMLASICAKLGSDVITFQKPTKNGNLVTILDGVTVAENTNINVSSLGTPIALLEKAQIKTIATKSFSDTLYDFNNGGLVKCTFRGKVIYLLPIGNMKINNLTSQVQEWELLMAPATAYNTLLNLYQQGLVINLNNNTMYHSDYNTLHFVKYNYVLPNKYNFKEIYDDWFNDRNDAWILNPAYVQMLQKDDVIIDQIITRGMGIPRLSLYRCRDGKFVTNFYYAPVTPAQLTVPDILLECRVDLSSVPSDQYFIVFNYPTGDDPANTLLVPFQGNTDPDTFEFTLAGTPRVDDIINVFLRINGDPIGTSFRHLVVVGEGIPEILAALKALILTNEGINAVNDIDLDENSGLEIVASFSISGEIFLNHITYTPIAISERIELKTKWLGTIIIESSNSKNLVGAFFSTGWKSILRVEGLVKKWQPGLNDFIAEEENGDVQMLYQVNTRKRTIRFGTAYGLPDYLGAVKIPKALSLDNLFVEGVGYTLATDEKISPSEDVDGHPLYYYNVNLDLRTNVDGQIFGVPYSTQENVILVIDPIAMGLPEGSTFNIELING